jgi:enoyl-CoA hydratase
MSQAAVRCEIEDDVAVVRVDDGKVNALSHGVLDAMLGALDRAEKEQAAALAWIGRPGVFCAGFDLSVIRQGGGSPAALVQKGVTLGIRLLEWPTPVVLGVTGHALAMGAILLCTADERIGADGAFKVGLNEVAIGMTLPAFALEITRERLSRRHFYRATSGAEIYDPRSATDVGYLDAVVPPGDVESRAIARARALATGLDKAAHYATKTAVRAGLLDRLRATLADRR